MRKKRIISLIMVALMSITVLSACTNDPADTTASVSPSTTTDNGANPTESPGNTEFPPKEAFVMPTTQVEVKTDEKHTVFVDAAKGNDSNAGTESAPVKTLAKAQELVKGKTGSMTEDVVVYLRGGTYVLDETINFDSSDSGKNGFNVIWTAYKGETAVISGGSNISGWTQVDESKNIWSAPANGVNSRDFFVNGERAVRARSGELSNVGEVADMKAFTLAAGQLPESFARPQDLEVMINALWQFDIVRVKDVVKENDYQRLILTDESWNLLHITAGVEFDVTKDYVKYVENAYELLDEPGEWYLNTDEDKIYYIPKAGQDITKTEAVLGNLESLFTFDGEINKVVENITLTGLTFSHTTWLQANNPEGLCVIQSNVYKNVRMNSGTAFSNPLWMDPTSAIFGTFVNNINITRNIFTNLGNGGVHLEKATKNSNITNNYFNDCASSGITLGGFHDEDHAPIKRNGSDYDEGIKKLSENNNITDNYITNIGTQYKAACGILVGYVARTKVEYNTITDVPYTGISFGWGWGYNKQELNDRMYYMHDGKFLLCDNSISYNYIENIMNVMFDGGAIYTLGRMDNTTIKGNYINKVNNDFGGIYLDNGSSGFTVTDNAMMNCHRNWIYKGDYNYIFDNYTRDDAVAEDLEMLEPVRADETHYRFENNYMWDDAKVSTIRDAAGARNN